MNNSQYIAGVFVICFLYMAAYIGFNYYAQYTVIQRDIAAFQSENIQSLQARVNWNRTRLNLIRHYPAGHKIVHHYIQPDFIKPLVGLKKQVFADRSEEDFVRDIGFNGPFQFFIVLGYPKNNTEDGIVTIQESMTKVKLYLRLEGWKWKIYKIDVPDFLMPTKILAAEEMQNFIEQSSGNEE